MNVHKVGIGLASALLVVSSTGCGKVADKATNKVSEKGLEKVIEGQSGGKVDLDVKGGGFKVQTKDGSKVQSGSGSSMPDDWPKVLALPKGFQIKMSTTTKDSGNPLQTVMASGNGDGAKIFATYKKNLESAGYEIESESSSEIDSNNQMRQLTAGRGASNATVMVTTDHSKGKANLILSASTDVKVD